MTQDALRTQQQEWDLYQADPRALFENIAAGLRKSTISCQYFVNNLPKICKYWEDGDPGHCSYGEDEDPESTEKGIPSGLGGAGKTCDFLGRRSWCDKYFVEEEGEEGGAGEEWICCAPDPYRTGLTKLVNSAPESSDVTVRALKKSEIGGYCSEEGVGKCDGEGCGRGCDAAGNLKDLVKLPIKCAYYRPWRMGFGFIEPQTYKAAIKEYSVIYEEAYSQFVQNRKLGKRLPLQFSIYNLRAAFQPCMWWHGAPAVFTPHIVDGENDVIRLSEYPGTECTCKNPLVDPFVNPQFYEGSEPQYLLREVWAEGNTIMCNGAKPECPCYTGKWEHCVDKKMYPGMKITAYQILELRFWTYPWKTQEQYEKFFENRPNWSDPTTADIFTFTRWAKGTEDAVDGTLVGKRFKLLAAGDSSSCKMRDYSFKSVLDIEETEILYAQYGIEGTTTEDQVHFPTLVRDLWSFSAKRLIVIYPYESFEYSPCVIKSNLMNHCNITAAGFTEQSVKVYFINSTFIQSFSPKYISNYLSILDIPIDELSLFYEETKAYITACLITSPNYIVEVTSDSNGCFLARLLRVEYNEINKLFIVVDGGDGTYVFDKKQILPKFGGGTINQTSFKFNCTGTNYMPEVFMPSAIASFKTQLLGCSKSVAVHPIASWGSLTGPPTYTYSLDWVEVTVSLSEGWTTIGPTYYIWAEIPDINLNYVFRWEFVEGTISVTDINDVVSSFDLELVFPLLEDSEIKLDGAENTNNIKSSAAATLERISIPPNVLILSPKHEEGLEPPGFGMVKTAVLSIKYKYLKVVVISSQRVAANTFFPTAEVDYIDSLLLVEYDKESGNYLVKGIRSIAPSFLGLFLDEDGRIISAFATKLYTNVSIMYCRSVEIYYKYRAEATAYELMPTLGSFATERMASKNIGGATHFETPPCGDHECGEPCIGPEWFPFTSCSESNRYRFNTGPGSCYMPYQGEGREKYSGAGGWIYRPDYRYCYTAKYEAWSGLSSPLATCKVPWQLYYSEKTGGDIFDGYVNIVAEISTKDYDENGWEYPPFGNYGRDFLERYMSKDHCEGEYTKTSGEKVTVNAWMPAVIDNNSFYFSFNCFDTYSNLNAEDCFSFVDQFNFLLNQDIEEEIYKEGADLLRFSWDELFVVEGVVGYNPKPTVFIGESPFGYFYKFKYSDLAWAWQEEWRNIERAIVVEDKYKDNSDIAKLSFLKLMKPSYIYDDMKKQHRFICKEGYYYIKFDGPEYSEGKITKFPSLSLLKEGEEDGIGRRRYFNIMYDSYDVTPIEWEDEGNGENGGSSDGNIYEQTSLGDWINYDNMLYAIDESSADPVEERTFYTAGMFGWEKSYYNRGIIVNMLKADLTKLPTDEVLVSYEIKEKTAVSGTQVIPDTDEAVLAVLVTHYSIKIAFEGEDGVAISKIILKGFWGLYTPEDKKAKDVYISKPGFSMPYLSIMNTNLSLGYVIRETPMATKSSAAERTSLIEYIIEYKVSLTPKYIIADRVKELTIDFSAYPGEGIYITTLEVYGSEYSTPYMERIAVVEQKFVVSKFKNNNTDKINLDGPSGILSSREGIAPVVPVYAYPDTPIISVNKLRFFGGSEKYKYDLIGFGWKKRVEATLSTLQTIEWEVQKKIYEDTCAYEPFGDHLYYRFITPIMLDTSEKSAIYSGLTPVIFNCESTKLLWEDNDLANGFVRYSFWTHGGHYWQWSSGFERVKCYYIGNSLYEIYHQQLVCVLHAGGGGSVLDPIYVWSNSSLNATRNYEATVSAFTGL